eukprot:scaffold262299_cov39-Tisochrysis_lutea.AAC.1
MQGMFANATAFSQDLSAWDVSKVINFEGMFEGSALAVSKQAGDVLRACRIHTAWASLNFSWIPHIAGLRIGDETCQAILYTKRYPSASFYLQELFDDGLYEISASSFTSSGNAPEKTFDNSDSTEWSTRSLASMEVQNETFTGHWVQLETPWPIVLKEASIYSSSSMDGVLFLGSTDSVHWDFMRKELVQIQGRVQLNMQDTRGYRYVRMFIVSSSNVAIKDLKLLRSKVLCIPDLMYVTMLPLGAASYEDCVETNAILSFESMGAAVRRMS